MSPDRGVQPALAKSWQRLDDTTWEFALRPGVVFHDGSAFTAADVIYSACRILSRQDSPASFAMYAAAIASMEAKDPQTLIIRTSVPYPLLAAELTIWGIVSAGAADIEVDADGCRGLNHYAGREAFDDPDLAIGTGPYRVVDHVAGESLRLTSFADHWGAGRLWQNIEFKVMADDGARLAALLARSVDMIDKPPPASVERLKNHGGFSVMRLPTPRVVHLQFDHSPGSPFADLRVRRAVSRADRPRSAGGGPGARQRPAGDRPAAVAEAIRGFR